MQIEYFGTSEEKVVNMQPGGAQGFEFCSLLQI